MIKELKSQLIRYQGITCDLVFNIYPSIVYILINVLLTKKNKIIYRTLSESQSFYISNC